MRNVLQVLDRSDPHRWRDVNTTIRALASTKLQDSLNKASLAIASLPSNYTNFTRSYPSNISNSSIIRQYPSYFTALRRRHQHHSFNQTSIELPVNFHQNYIDDDGLITVLFHSFDGLHCATNSVPCDPDKANISEVQADRQINSPIIGATVRNNSIWKSRKLCVMCHMYTAWVACVISVSPKKDQQLFSDHFKTDFSSETIYDQKYDKAPYEDRNIPKFARLF
nr:uncharacterized protein LOC123750334 [Procambarus clarkii]